MVQQSNVIIDPTKESYSFRFSNHDCYKLATGRCTFELSDEEFGQEKAKCNSPYMYEASVTYCRELLEMMKVGGSLSATTSTGIRAEIKKCGHIQFNDGQHRSCIAKKNRLPELYFDKLDDDVGSLCQSCRLEKVEAQRQNRFLDMLKNTRKHNIEEAIHFYITDEKL
ncbi:hypothetical protein ACOMCU_22410 [Lysinibacillus sp. UGB7]|uniref:hypothetical protein n=1 Tax=Lysinibacillus sp. UGB7 TaxID=3411039 RepID=UPI003B819EE3